MTQKAELTVIQTIVKKKWADLALINRKFKYVHGESMSEDYEYVISYVLKEFFKCFI